MKKVTVLVLSFCVSGCASLHQPSPLYRQTQAFIRELEEDTSITKTPEMQLLLLQMQQNADAYERARLQGEYRKTMMILGAVQAMRPTPQPPVRLRTLPTLALRYNAGAYDSNSMTGDTAKYLGNWSSNEYALDSINNPYGAGNPYNPDSITNEFGKYGNPFSPYSVTNPYATQAPMLFDSQGNYRGRLSSNTFDPDSISNPFGRFGNPLSTDSINNPFGAGNPFSPDSPSNPFGLGLEIYGDD